MRSRLLLNLILSLVVIGLVVVVINTADEKDAAPATRLTNLDPGDVNRIDLQRQNGEPLTLVRKQDVWYMQAPYQLAANEYRVQALLKTLQAEYRSRHDLGGRDPAQYGLDNPRASITYNDSLTIEFGDTEPLSKERYLRIDDQLYLLPDTLYYHTLSPVTGYLSHALLPPGRITALQLPTMQLSLREGQWHIEPPREDRSADALTELAANWRGAQALKLEPLADEVLSTADILVTLDSREQPLRFSLQQQDDRVALLRHDVKMRYVINEEIRQQLLQLPEAIAEPNLENQPGKPEDSD